MTWKHKWPQVCSFCVCVWEWQGAWLLSLRLDQHAGWGVGKRGDWIQRLQAPALPLISPLRLTWPLCCCSAEAQLGHKDTYTSLSLPASPSPICFLICLSFYWCVSPSLRLYLTDWLSFSSLVFAALCLCLSQSSVCLQRCNIDSKINTWTGTTPVPICPRTC